MVELPHMASMTNWNLNMSVMLANAMAALMLNLAVFLLIGKTSALTMNIAGVIKDWMLIYLSYSLFKAPVSRTSLAGYFFCCSGVMVYNYMKLQVRGRAAASGQLSFSPASAATTWPSLLRRLAKQRGRRFTSPLPLRNSAQAIKARVAGGQRPEGRGDEERPLLAERSKDDILGEIRRLQAEMLKLEDRVQSSAKLMGGDQPGAVAQQPAPAQASDKSS
jgi:hypothetical protein